MNILDSKFIDLAPKGAISLNITSNVIAIKDSTFMRCNNTESGGAVRITSKNSKHDIQRCCGTLCHTLNYGNDLDYGQFLFVDCSEGETRQESLSVERSIDHLVSQMHNGPITNAGDALHSCSNSNVSNCHCRIGSGFCILDANSAHLSFMNFANDTSYLEQTIYPGYWIAAVFHRSDGEVSKSNFIECKNTVLKTGDPPGTYISCAFVNCVNYYADFINKHYSQALDISFPFGCAARKQIETAICHFPLKLSFQIFLRAFCLIQPEKYSKR